MNADERGSNRQDAKNAKFTAEGAEERREEEGFYHEDTKCTNDAKKDTKRRFDHARLRRACAKAAS